MTALCAPAREGPVSVRGTVAIPAGIAVLSAAAILAPQIGYGAGLGWDPVNYLCVARNLLAGAGFFGCGGRWFSPWAPGYPAMLAVVGGLLDLDPYDVAGPLNAAAFGALVFVAGQWLLRNLESRVLAVLGCLAVASSPLLMGIAFMAYSEMAFLLFAMLALTRADRYFDDGRAASLAGAAAFTALACATRYAGVVIAAVIAAGLILERRSSPRRKARRLWVYGLASAAPVCAWMLRNLIEESWFFMPRQPVDHPLPEVLADVARTVGAWMLHDARPHGALGAAALLFLAAGVGWRGLRALPRAARPRERSFLLFGGFALAYAVFYTYTTTVGYHEHGVQGRHLLPLCIPLLFAALLGADRAAGAERDRRQGRHGLRNRAAARILAAGLLLWVSWGAYPPIRDALHGGFPANSFYWSLGHADSEAARRSEVVRYLRADAGRGGTVWSNAKGWLEAHAGGMAAHSPLPEARPDAADALAEWFEARARDGDRAVWIHDPARARAAGYDAADIYGLPDISLLAALKDGLIFRVGGSRRGGRGATLADAVSKRTSLAASSVFAVHVGQNESHLIYVKRACDDEAIGPAFFLRVHPVRAGDLSPGRRERGFDELDFDFTKNGIRDKDVCLIFVPLPEYAIARISTGQRAAREIWRVEIPFRGGAAGTPPS